MTFVVYKSCVYHDKTWSYHFVSFSAGFEEADLPVNYTETSKCLICTTVFKEPLALLQHLRKKEGISSANSCEFCPFVYLNKTHYIQHMISQHGFKDHVCTICGKTVEFKTNFRRHTLGHRREKPFACTVCPARFKRKQYLKDHMSAHHAHMGIRWNIAMLFFVYV